MCVLTVILPQRALYASVIETCGPMQHKGDFLSNKTNWVCYQLGQSQDNQPVIHLPSVFLNELVIHLIDWKYPTLEWFFFGGEGHEATEIKYETNRIKSIWLFLSTVKERKFWTYRKFGKWVCLLYLIFKIWCRPYTVEVIQMDVTFCYKSNNFGK